METALKETTFQRLSPDLLGEDVVTSNLEKLFYAGQYNEVLAQTIEDPTFNIEAPTVQWIVGTLSMLGRSEEAAGFYRAYIHQLTPASQIFTRFYYGLAVCRERRMDAARRLFLENVNQVRASESEWEREHGPQATERLKFFAYQGLAFFRYSTGYYRQAFFWALKAVTASSAANYHHGSCLAHEIYGHVQLQLGDVSAGMRNLEKALDKALKLGQGAWTQTFAASVRLYRATYGLKAAHEISAELVDSLAKCRYDDAYTKASLQIQLARNMTLTGDVIGAARMLEDSSSLVYRLDNPYLETNYNLCLAYVQFLRGNYSIALSIARNADARAKDRGYMPSRLRALGIQTQILERMGLFKERLAVLQEVRFLTTRTAGFIPRRIMQRRDFLSGAWKRGEDPLGDLIDDVVANRKDVVADILASGWLFLLRAVVGALPSQKMLVFDLESNSLTLLFEGHVVHREEGCSLLIKKLLIALSETQELSKEEITHALWAQSYNPLRHDTLIYGLIARTRKLLQPFADWIEVTETGYRLAEGVVLRNGRHLMTEHEALPAFAQVHEPERVTTPQNAPSKLPTQSNGDAALSTGFAAFNLRQLEMLELARKGEKIVPKEMLGRFEVSDATMTRDLAKLVESGLLRRCGAGRATFYVATVN